jgi:hypothetical protein
MSSPRHYKIIFAMNFSTGKNTSFCLNFINASMHIVYLISSTHHYRYIVVIRMSTKNKPTRVLDYIDMVWVFQQEKTLHSA